MMILEPDKSVLTFQQNPLTVLTKYNAKDSTLQLLFIIFLLKHFSINKWKDYLALKQSKKRFADKISIRIIT